jgi:hypothetical protein
VLRAGRERYACSGLLSHVAGTMLRLSGAGKDGKVFRIYKLRTTFFDAEQRRAYLLTSKTDRVLFQLCKDPRATAVGVHLRRSSIDELSQLPKVLLGHMSLVGPRPVPYEVARYTEHVRRGLVVKPGLTGLWQVNGRSGLSREESVRFCARWTGRSRSICRYYGKIPILIRDSGAIRGDLQVMQSFASCAIPDIRKDQRCLESHIRVWRSPVITYAALDAPEQEWQGGLDAAR